MSEAFRIIQISDNHILADPLGELLGVKTTESFKAVVEAVKKELTPNDLILLSGDLTQDGSKISYERLADLLKPLKTPVYCVPGNHDDPKMIAQVYPRASVSNHKHIVLKHWHLILLNSQRYGAVEGFLDPAQLTYLQQCLRTYPEHHAVISFHHQPTPVGSAWLDKLWLTNAKEFWDIIAGFPNVKLVLFGHVHQEFAGEVNGVQVYSAPSTCIQFKPNVTQFALDNLPQGYRITDLFEDGRFKSRVQRLPAYVGFFDEHAKGY